MIYDCAKVRNFFRIFNRCVFLVHFKLSFFLDCFVVLPYNDEVVNPHTIRLSGLLRKLAMTVHVTRHCEEERRSNPEIKALF